MAMAMAKGNGVMEWAQHGEGLQPASQCVDVLTTSREPSKAQNVRESVEHQNSASASASTPGLAFIAAISITLSLNTQGPSLMPFFSLWPIVRLIDRSANSRSANGTETVRDGCSMASSLSVEGAGQSETALDSVQHCIVLYRRIMLRDLFTGKRKLFKHYIGE